MEGPEGRNIQRTGRSGAEYDVLVLGSGPAGLQAAIHAARRKRRVLVMGRAEESNCRKAHVENVAGLPETDGAGLVRTACEQAARSGAELCGEDALGLRKDGSLPTRSVGPQSGAAAPGFVVKAESGEELRARALVIATGVSLERLGVPGEKDLLGRGVSYCVDCDAGFFRGKPVVVTGGGSAAAEGALLMLEYASEVHLVSEGLACSEALARKVETSAVRRHVPGRIARIEGTGSVEAALLESGARLEVNGVFIELGAKGVLELTSGLGVELDPESLKYIRVDRAQKTNVEGVFAAGDVTGRPWQIAKALGEGCVAGLGAAEYAAEYAERADSGGAEKA